MIFCALEAIYIGWFILSRLAILALALLCKKRLFEKLSRHISKGCAKIVIKLADGSVQEGLLKDSNKTMVKTKH